MTESSSKPYTKLRRPSKWRRQTSNRIKLEIKKAVENRLTPHQIFTRYVDTSTLHGINYACYNTALLRRLFWSCCMIAGAIYFVDKLHKGINKYTSYPFSTLSTQGYVESLTFPAVSLCLVNSFNFSEVVKSELEPSHGKNVMLLEKRKVGDPDSDIPGDKLIKILEDVSIPIEKIFLRCEWIARDTRDPSVLNKTICGTMNFTNYFNELSQRCYTFNSGKSGHRLLSVDHSGLSYAYELLINTTSDEAVSIFPYGGIKVVLHDQSQPPLMSEGFMIAPGFTTYVRMNKIEKKGLPPPYATSCGHKTLKHHAHYSQKACLLELLTEVTGERCKCRAIFMPDNGLPICSYNQVVTCMHAVKESFNPHENRHLCPIECSEVSFDVRLTEGRYKPGREKELNQPQSDFEVPEDHEEIHTQGLGDLLQQQHPRHIQNNLVNVFFYYGEMTQEVHEQEGSLDFYQFLGDMGGEIGLMLGASILSFFEIIDLLMFLLYNMLLRLHRGDNDTAYEEALAYYEAEEKVKEEKYKEEDELDLRELIFDPYTPWEIEYTYDEFGDRVTTL